MLPVMSKPQKKQKMYVRPTPEARHAMKRVLTAMQSPSLFGDELLQEDFIAATWLWMAGMDANQIAQGIGPHVAAIQAYWAMIGEKEVIGPDLTVEQISGPARAAADSEAGAVKRKAKARAGGQTGPKKGPA